MSEKIQSILSTWKIRYKFKIVNTVFISSLGSFTGRIVTCESCNTVIQAINIHCGEAQQFWTLVRDLTRFKEHLSIVKNFDCLLKWFPTFG